MMQGAPMREGGAQGTFQTACGVEQPVDVVSISDVTLSAETHVDQRLVAALAGFMPALQDIAHAHLGQRISGLRIAAGYVCRTRNRQPGARISRHAFGYAIDIAAFTLENGRTVSVLGGWEGQADEKAFLRAVHDAACGPFNTVLGPSSDSYHRDHFHFDIDPAMRRGPYCR